MKSRLIVILGPTAVGKTGAAIALAKRLNTEIISGDSQLVYRGFDIGSAKPTPEELAAVPHHLVNILDGNEGYNVTDFCVAAREKIAELNAAGKIPILCGGTGLYVKALLEGYKFNETTGNEEYRESLEQEARAAQPENPRGYLLEKLQGLDPAVAEALANRDVRRIVRAIEVAAAGESISRERVSEAEDTAEAKDLVYDACVIGLIRERSLLYERVNLRVDIMLQEGLTEEVRRLLETGIDRSAQSMRAIGYRETAAYLAGEISQEKMADDIKKNTRHFAKRQLTWYRRMPYIHWVDPTGYSEETLNDELLRIFREHFEKIGD
ncbi:MAG: tRNA (adenosine(37)-N6)-dimethylallyltransferase MiaA [Selenomonadaceae bacterium]|nr:tRNA (adenosine(37)-N6)-dimethylallyltransferase MiaA [Selenomonadaceae bacterium]